MHRKLYEIIDVTRTISIFSYILIYRKKVEFTRSTLNSYGF